AERITSMSVELADVAEEVSNLMEQLQFDPEQAQLLQENMDTWLDLKRKHGGDLAAVIEARDKMRRQLEEQGDIEGALAKLEKQAAEALKEAKGEESALRAQRGKAAKALAGIAAKTIAQLGFAKADFQIRIVPLAAPGPQGDCGVEFLFSPNVGEA